MIFKTCRRSRHIDSNIHGFLFTIPIDGVKTTIGNRAHSCANDSRNQPELISFGRDALSVFYHSITILNIKLKYNIRHRKGEVLVLLTRDKASTFVLDIGLVRNARNLGNEKQCSTKKQEER